MLKAYIVEDEIMAINLLETYLERLPFIELVGTSRDPMKALKVLKKTTIDLLFLDINMAELNGLDLYRKLKNPPSVVFTTAYPEHAVEAFDLKAVDYLLKPISFPRFLKTINRIRNQNTLIEKSKTKPPVVFSDFLYIKSGSTTYKIKWKEILYLEKKENYVIYHTLEKRILSRQTLSDLAAIFPNYFCRIHKSYAVSILHLLQVERTMIAIADKHLPIGRKYREKLFGCLKGHQML